MKFWEYLCANKDNNDIYRYHKVWLVHPYISKDDMETIPVEERIEVIRDLADYKTKECSGSLQTLREFYKMNYYLRLVYCIYWTECEMNMEGMLSFFTAHMSVFLFDIIEFLSIIGATKKSNVLAKAAKAVNIKNVSRWLFELEIFNEELSYLYDDDHERYGDKYIGMLDKFEKEYYTLDEEEDLFDLLKEYIAKHVKEIPQET